MKNRTTIKTLPVLLSKDELLEISNEMTDKTLEVDDIENQKKRINPLRDEITKLSKKFKNGYEERTVNCRVEFNEPIIGKKTIFRNDTNEMVEILNMLAEEMQEDFSFQEEENSEAVKQLAEGTPQLEEGQAQIEEAEIIEDNEAENNE